MDHYQFLEALRRIHERAHARIESTKAQQAAPIPRDGAGWHAIALAHQQDGQVEAAIAAWRQALASPIQTLELVDAITQQLRGLGQDPVLLLSPDPADQAPADLSPTADTGFSLPHSLLELALREDWNAALPLVEDAYIDLPASQWRADNLALVLGKLGKEAHARCILAATLVEQERWLEAAEAFLRLSLSDVLASETLGYMLRSLHYTDREELALELARTAVGLGRWEPRSYYARAAILLDLNREDEALEVLRTGAIDLDNWWLRLQSGLVLAPVPASSDAVSAADDRVHRFIRELEQLRLPTDPVELDSLARVLEPNFYLAYREQPDLDPVRRFGQFVCRVVSASDGSGPAVASRRAVAGRKIRIGYVTRHANVHSVTRHFAGWFGNFDHTGFETHLFPLSSEQDWMRLYLQGQVDFHHPATQDFKTAVQTIRDADLDLLVHVAIGMDPLTFQIAALRLAPVQCAFWGHPVSTGLPSVDYFISAEGMEPVDGNTHYTERLVTLPGIGLTLPENAVPAAPVSRSDLGIPDHARVFVSAQSLFKYLPQHDRLYARIAREVPDAMFLFSMGDSQAWTRTFRNRIEASFRAQGMTADEHVRILPKRSLSEYHGLLRCCDAMLDTVGWSGGQTSYDAIACNLPIVTLPGQMMRGRQTYGILRQIGVEETIATDPDDYVRIAVRLGKDRAWRDEVSFRIHERKHLLYNDLQPVRGLEAFFRWAVGAAQPGDLGKFRLWPESPTTTAMPTRPDLRSKSDA